jgi:hypothetical protein
VAQKVWVVVVRVGANEVDDLPIAIDRLAVIASGLVGHSETIPAVMHVREAFDKILIELALVDEIDGVIG